MKLRPTITSVSAALRGLPGVLTSRRAALAGGVLLCLAAAGVVAWSPGSSGDYGAGSWSGDDPAAAMRALLHGHFGAAAHSQPVIGLTSILLRLPAVALAPLFGGGSMLEYRLGVFVCALVAGLVAIVVARWAHRRGRSAAATAMLVTVMVANPETLGSRLLGHPEELLGGALCLAAVLAAVAERPVLTGALLGLAVGTKEWALVAVVPVLLACPSQRRRMLLVSLVVAAPLVLTLPLLDPGAFIRASSAVGRLHPVYFRSWWWELSATHSITIHIFGHQVTTILHRLPFGLSRAQVSWLAPAVALGLGWRYRRVQRGRDPVDAVGLLALLLLLRCTLDPSFSSYYVVPFLAALIAWETIARAGLPLASLLAMAAFWWTEQPAIRPEATLCDLALTVGLTAYLARATLRAPRESRTSIRAAPNPAPATPPTAPVTGAASAG